MERTVHGVRIELVEGDITRHACDALVNAANSGLRGGGGVDGAIHRAGGPSIMAETREKYPQGCPTGDAVITGAGALPARFVIHAVGPIYHDGSQGEPDLLARAYRRSLELAADHGCRSVAFPSLSTGAYGYPIDQAAPIALRTVADFVRTPRGIEHVRFVLFGRPAFDAFGRALQALEPDAPSETGGGTA